MKHIPLTIRKGSALLVAILVMGILLTLTLGLSALVIREITQTGDVVAAGKAYFAAEAGVENALLDLHQHLPGYQTVTGGNPEGWVEIEESDPANLTDQKFVYRYRIRNQGDAYPYFDEDQPIFLTPGVGVTKKFVYDVEREATYNVLPLNQTVTIPLFVENEDGTAQDVQEFLIEYYVKFDQDLPTEFAGIDIKQFDILRWKVFGNTCIGDCVTGVPSGRTEAISDFFPAKSGVNADNPVCIGTTIGLDPTGISCNYPVLDTESGSDPGNLWSAARECYASDAGIIVSGSEIKTGDAGGCSIETFVKNHKRNYVTLTNVVNPDIIGVSDPILRAQKANIYYRIVARNSSETTPKLPREYADISADGFASDKKVKQSIDVKLRLNSFLPVFNFSLYRTDPETPDPEESVVLPFSLVPLPE